MKTFIYNCVLLVITLAFFFVGADMLQEGLMNLNINKWKIGLAEFLVGMLLLISSIGILIGLIDSYEE